MKMVFPGASVMVMVIAGAALMTVAGALPVGGLGPVISLTQPDCVSGTFGSPDCHADVTNVG